MSSANQCYNISKYELYIILYSFWVMGKKFYEIEQNMTTDWRIVHKVIKDFCILKEEFGGNNAFLITQTINCETKEILGWK